MNPSNNDFFIAKKRKLNNTMKYTTTELYKLKEKVKATIPNSQVHTLPQCTTFYLGTSEPSIRICLGS